MPGLRAAEGELTYNDRRQLVEDEITERMKALAGVSYCWVIVIDMTDTWAVYRTDGEVTWQVDYQIGADGAVSVGQPVEVRRVTSYEQVGAGEVEMAAGESTVVATDRLVGRVLEASTAEGGGRIFAVRIIAYGDSKNRRRYPEAVMRQAVGLYEGAKAYDHHRTDEELATSTVQGLVGTFRKVKATAEGLDAEFHVLPSAAHVAEALDASLTNQADGLEPLVGFSHDVVATFKPVTDASGDRLMEATQIVSVLSADVVADPAAGGLPTRAVAGGTTRPTTPPLKESHVPNPTEGQPTEPLGGTATATVETERPASFREAAEAAKERSTEASYPKGSLMAAAIIERALADVADTALRAKLAESVTGLLPERFTEAELLSAVQATRDLAARFEVAGLTPSVPDIRVGQEDVDGRRKRMDATFDGDFRNGYRSLKEAYADITGDRSRYLDSEEMARTILEAVLGFHSDMAAGGRRVSESVDTTTFGYILGDAMTRRMVKDYNRPDLAIWKPLVSSEIPVLDFRTQRIDRLGGYGVLPSVAQGAPYQPLTTPGNEEATYSLGKKGGTEDLTLEAIANDDMRVVIRIPQALGRAAARTLFRDVLNLLITNATCSYDATALFAAGHGNTATNALSQSALDTSRLKMRKQQAYGDTTDDLSITPKFLLVPPDLESLAFQLATSAVALGANANTATGANASDIPNIHRGLTPIVVDYWSATSTTFWALVADPADVPTIEVGYFNGRQEPELFVQDAETVGSRFDRDVVTWKIRFIYGLTLLDHRGFQRGNS